MRELTEDEKGYLRIVYENGYRYIATEKHGDTYFYETKPHKYDGSWYGGTCIESLLEFGTSWNDEHPTKIADLLGIDDTDWSQVAPFTPVWVRERDGQRWYRKVFLEFVPTNVEKPFKVTSYCAWTHYDTYSNYAHCKLATQEEIDEVIDAFKSE